MLHKNKIRFTAAAILAAVCLSGCLKSTYPEDRVKESILKILRKEYSIPMAQVAVTGKTINLYLPVERLFTADLDDIKVRYLNIPGLTIKNPVLVWTAKILSAPQDAYWEALARLYHLNILRWFKLNWVVVRTEKKKIEKIQDAIELHPEVQDEIGQMLFAVARVARSTDLKVNFYTTQITDVRSGHEFILEGYLEDMNRLQLMDISQAEYHQRMLKDTRVNNRALVHFPVRSFFMDLNQKTLGEVREKYFARLTSKDWLKRFYFSEAQGDEDEVSQATWEVEDMRSFLSPAGGRALVYVKVDVLPRDSRSQKMTEGEQEFLFETSIRGKAVQIVRIIPFTMLREMMKTMPEFNVDEKMLRDNIKSWKSEFEPEEVILEDFFARQMTMRLYEPVYQDERIANTFTDIHYDTRFREKPEREFVFDLRASLKDPKARTRVLEHEDMLYLEEKFMKTAATILHNYQYKNFAYAAIELPVEGERAQVSAADLELFYKGRKKLQEILTFTQIPPVSETGEPEPAAR